MDIDALFEEADHNQPQSMAGFAETGEATNDNEKPQVPDATDTCG